MGYFLTNKLPYQTLHNPLMQLSVIRDGTNIDLVNLLMRFTQNGFQNRNLRVKMTQNLLFICCFAGGTFLSSRVRNSLMSSLHACYCEQSKVTDWLRVMRKLLPSFTAAAPVCSLRMDTHIVTSLVASDRLLEYYVSTNIFTCFFCKWKLAKKIVLELYTCFQTFQKGLSRAK